jgi:hypothetical protein
MRKSSITPEVPVIRISLSLQSLVTRRMTDRPRKHSWFSEWIDPRNKNPFFLGSSPDSVCFGLNERPKISNRHNISSFYFQRSCFTVLLSPVSDICLFLLFRSLLKRLSELSERLPRRNGKTAPCLIGFVSGLITRSSGTPNAATGAVLSWECNHSS